MEYWKNITITLPGHDLKEIADQLIELNILSVSIQDLRDTKKNTVVVIITSDKAYKNIEKKAGYKETDILAGIDPYSASKSSAEIAIKSYKSRL